MNKNLRDIIFSDKYCLSANAVMLLLTLYDIFEEKMIDNIRISASEIIRKSRLSKRTFYRVRDELVNKKLIFVSEKQGCKSAFYRFCVPMWHTSGADLAHKQDFVCQCGTQKSALYNKNNNIYNIYNNNNNIDTDNQNSFSEDVFEKPNREQIISFITQNELEINADIFIRYYESVDWKTQSGDPITNWKQKAILWHKREVDRHEERQSAKEVESRKPKESRRSPISRQTDIKYLESVLFGDDQY